MGCIFCSYDCDCCEYQSIINPNKPEIIFKSNHPIDILTNDKSDDLLLKYYLETKHIDDDIKPSTPNIYKRQKIYKECFPYGIDILK